MSQEQPRVVRSLAQGMNVVPQAQKARLVCPSLLVVVVLLYHRLTTYSLSQHIVCQVGKHNGIFRRTPLGSKDLESAPVSQLYEPFIFLIA